jgi:uncharacterized surface protein with fasciclin (FAS1) repeats
VRYKLTGTAAAALAMTFTVAACGSSGPKAPSSASSHAPAAAHPAASLGAAAGSTTPAMSGTVGAGCKRIPASGPGSIRGMLSAQLVTAMSHNPLLSDLVRAIHTAGLTNALNRARDITMLAPDNAAFAAPGRGNLKKLTADKAYLIKVLRYHIVTGRVTSAQLATGKPLTTLLGLPVRPALSGSVYTINKAQVVCGNIHTANAVVYILDKVLIPST